MAPSTRMVKILDLSDAPRLADHDDVPLPQAVHESKKDVNDIFATLRPQVTRGSASCCAESAKALKAVFESRSSNILTIRDQNHVIASLDTYVIGPAEAKAK